jgi:hypothetical protein
MWRELAQTFVDLADSIVDDFIVDDFYALDLLNVLVERCLDLLGVAAAGLLFADAQGPVAVGRVLQPERAARPNCSQQLDNSGASDHPRDGDRLDRRAAGIGDRGGSRPSVMDEISE